MSALDSPIALLAELTHRCPLRCPYCSNPTDLVRRSQELDTETWQRVLSEAAEIGVLQIHLSGGEPTVRKDIEQLVAHIDRLGLYANLITSGVLSDDQQLARLADAGLAHVQLSVQDSEEQTGDWVAGLPGSQQKKYRFAEHVERSGLALTINAVIHRQNIDRVDAIIDMGVQMKAQRIEIANVQYYGWGIRNRNRLMPRIDQLEAMNSVVEEKKKQLEGIIVIDYVVPDYYAKRPKACMNGWGRRFLNVSPEGNVLPCHAAETIPDMVFDNVKQKHLGEIWKQSEAFNRFRGTAWMKEPCKSCERREIDWGGCRCQALALTGSADNPDPVCALVPGHDLVAQIAEKDASSKAIEFDYRGFSGGII